MSQIYLRAVGSTMYFMYVASKRNMDNRSPIQKTYLTQMRKDNCFSLQKRSLMLGKGDLGPEQFLSPWFKGEICPQRMIHQKGNKSYSISNQNCLRTSNLGKGGLGCVLSLDVPKRAINQPIRLLQAIVTMYGSYLQKRSFECDQWLNGIGQPMVLSSKRR